MGTHPRDMLPCGGNLFCCCCCCCCCQQSPSNNTVQQQPLPRRHPQRQRQPLRHRGSHDPQPAVVPGLGPVSFFFCFVVIVAYVLLREDLSGSCHARVVVVRGAWCVSGIGRALAFFFPHAILYSVKSFFLGVPKNKKRTRKRQEKKEQEEGHGMMAHRRRRRRRRHWLRLTVLI